MENINNVFDKLSLYDVVINESESIKLTNIISELLTIPNGRIDLLFFKDKIQKIKELLLTNEKIKFHIFGNEICPVENNENIDNELSYLNTSILQISQLTSNYIDDALSDFSLRGKVEFLNNYINSIIDSYEDSIKNNNIDIFVFKILIGDSQKFENRKAVMLNSILKDINLLILESVEFKRLKEKLDYFKVKIEKDNINKVIDNMSLTQNNILDIVNKREEKLKSQDEEKNQLLQLAGEKQIISGHLKQADKERMRATILFFIGLLFLIIPSIVAILSFTKLYDTPNDWKLQLIRVLLSLVISIPGIYCIKESNSYKRDERHYRDLGLDLAAIPPYLREFDNETKKEFKKELSSKLFAKQRDIKSNTVPLDYQKLVEVIIKTISSKK
jgi:hypothetical protein